MSDEALREVVYGRGAHVDPMACVEDLSAEMAARRVEGYPHSIWQIVSHLNYWMEHDLSKIAGEDRRYPDHAMESWPEHPEAADEAQWEMTRQRFGELLGRVAEFAGRDEAELARVIHNAGAPKAPREASVRTMLWQIAAHNSYHTGQIALLRRQMGAWPPRRGGDTW